MNKKIFRSTCLVALSVFLASVVMIMCALYGYFENQIEERLASEAEYISHALENEGNAYLDGFSPGNNRITLINSDGTVVYDSTADISEMDNHSDREEIKKAIENGTGKSIRYSKILTEKTIYYAVRQKNGSILRISATQYTVITLLLGFFQPIAIVTVIVLILSSVLSARVSKSIITPINNLNLDNPEENEIYDELSPLLSKISKQKKIIEEQLNDARHRQEEFRLITENMAEGFLVIDSDTNLLTYNSSSLKLLDIKKPDSGSVLKLNRTGDFRTVVENVLSGKHSESTMIQNNRTYHLIANPVIDSNKVAGAVIVILDVTEKSQREKLRREFTANVSHELKTPLTSISGFAELMKNGGLPEADVIDFSKSIYDEAQRLITLVKDIIKLSELDEKKTLYEAERVNLYDIAKDVISHLSQDAKKKNISLNLIGESTVITGAKEIISEMIYNLCDNSIKYNRENGTVDVIITESENNVKLTVRDTGIGIPASHQNRVFERFYRVDKSHSKAIGGTGLGLSIVKHGAAYHDADIQLKSTEGKGTTVTVTFPKKHN